MKNNGNNLYASDYYIGLDVGTDSVGWAVTDLDYNVLKFKGNAMWGIRLFNEAQNASARRTARTSRRRLERRKQRLLWLEMLFNNEIAKIDPAFFIRLKESSLYEDDKSENAGKYSLFNDSNYTDKDYLREYPTIYHLRKELIESKEPHDIRLVYLAVHHIIKNRGHFLFSGEVEDTISNFSDTLEELLDYIKNEYEADITVTDMDTFKKTLLDSDMSITAKKSALKACIKVIDDEEKRLNCVKFFDMLIGATVNLSDLFNDDKLKDAEVKSLSFKKGIENNIDTLSDELGEQMMLILEAKKVYDSARLSQILNNNAYISEAKVDLYNKNAEQLKILKKYIRQYKPDDYKHVFSEKKEKLNNLAAYNGYKSKSGHYSCNQEDFCKFLGEIIKDIPESDEFNTVKNEIANKTFLTKLTSTDNGVIPNQLHKSELKLILKNAENYLPFLKESDETGKSISDKIIDLFAFKIPYYVGPLNRNSKYSWVVRTDEKIYPWNFNEVVNFEASANAFMNKLIGKCTYTGEYVLPQDSLLYSKYMVLNEINPLKVNGKPITVEIKQDIYRDLFENSKRKVTKKSIKNYLLSRGLIEKEDEISGIDDTVKAQLKSYHDFKSIIEKTKNTELVEDIIKNILVFGEDKGMLRKWLKSNCKGIDENDIAYICRMSYKEWGRLSKEFLTEIYSADKNSGEAISIMDMLWNTNLNIMQLLTSEYDYAKNAEEHRNKLVNGNRVLDDILDDMYVAPAVRRSIRQALRIADEIVDIKKSAPRKIFIEVARGTKEDLRNQRTVSRKDRLIALYKACGKDSDELFEHLKNEPEDSLRRDKLYLYYTQFGKCMYSGEVIDTEALLADNTHYDIDHIYPRSRIKDDSIDNRVLVKSELNRDKTNVYPLGEDCRKKMYSFWKMLKDKDLISAKKFERLTRSTELTDKELSDFVARQIVETQQSTKVLAAIMHDLYPETKLVYSKAGNVSDFRQEFDIIKCRDVNDIHHAKDAYLNIVVGNVYDTKFTDKFFLNIRKENYSLNKVFAYDVEGAWKKNETIETVKKQIRKNNILYTRMPYEAHGQLFDLQIMAAGKGQLPVKAGMDINRYGGYNKLSGAYFFAVEHTEKKKRVRTIETVLMHKKDSYEKDPIKFCMENGLVDPVIIIPKIYFDSLIEIEGNKVYITGRTGNNYVAKHSYQLSLDYQTEMEIKDIAKYVDRCIAQKKTLTPTKYDNISRETNTKLYSILREKLNANVYQKWFRILASDMDECKDTFDNLCTYDQCRVILEILKSFRCDRVITSLELLNGKKNVGIILFNRKISNYSSVKLVSQSITGLYEYKTELI